MTTVSVIIPFYEGVSWLEEAVESVLQQSFTDYEIIVVNDGSQEDCTHFLEQYGSQINYVLKENGGPSTARNKGIDLACGKYIAFLDSDDKWKRSKLEIQVNAMESSGAIWSYCGYETFGVGSNKTFRMTGSTEAELQRYHSPYIATPGVMVRREYLDTHPTCRFNPTLRYGQDAFFWLMINADNPILAIPDVLVEVRLRGSNAAKRAKVQLQARSNLWKCRKINKAELIDKFDVSILYKFASELCIVSAKILSVFEKKFPEKFLEILAKTLYVIPWCIFRIDRILK